MKADRKPGVFGGACAMLDRHIRSGHEQGHETPTARVPGAIIAKWIRGRLLAD